MLFCLRMRRSLGLSHDRLEIRCGCVDSKPLWNSRMGLSLVKQAGVFCSVLSCALTGDASRQRSSWGGSWEMPIGWKATSAEGDVHWGTTPIRQPNKPTELSFPHAWRRKSSYYVTVTASSRMLPYCMNGGGVFRSLCIVAIINISCDGDGLNYNLSCWRGR